MYTRRYALYGGLFGLSFPILGTVIEALTVHGAQPFGRAVLRSQATPLLWIIDLAPVVLAAAFAMAGRRQDALLEAQAAKRVQFHQTAGELTSAAQSLLATVSSFSSMTAETAASVRETTATMSQLSQTATKAALTAETVIGLAQNSRKTADDGASAAELSTTELARLAEEVRGLSRSIEGLNARMRDVFEVASVVNYIADRSQRLAESAADEVLKAGAEANGVGQLVAEMRHHADDAKRASAQVKGLLAEVHKAMLAAMTAAEIGIRRAEQGAQVAAGTGGSIRRLASALKESSDAAREIATVAQQQDHGIDQVLKAMNEIYLAAQETMSSTQQVAGQARSLNELALGLKKQVQQEPS